MTLEDKISNIPFAPTVLVVDDEKRIRDGCQKALTLDGFEVTSVESGDKALQMIEEQHYDIILLDLMMPGISGMEVLTHCKTLHPDSVIIVITGYATLEHAIEAMKNGAFDFISKPFSPEELRDVVSKAIEYIRTLQDIATEKSRVRVLINQLEGGVMATDASKKVALANPAFLRMMNYREESIGKPVMEIIKDEKLNSMIDEALSMPPDEFVELTTEMTIKGSAEQEDVIIGARCVPFRDRLGRNLGTITVLHDITKAKMMDQLKSDFVSMVAHEIKSPMNTVLAQLKIINDGLAGDVTPKQKEILDRTSERIMSLVDMSSDLLDLARIESGLVTQEKEKLNLKHILEDQVNFYQASAKDKGLDLVLDKIPELPPIMGNRQNIEEVFSNLISNATKYTPEGGRISIDAEVEKKYIRVSVADTGFGIPLNNINRIFDRFYRVKDDQTRMITGTGLGLSIVKSIIEAHNGMISVESEPGKGSTFFVDLPIVNDQRL
jgi:signal transduction histidine kinase